MVRAWILRFFVSNDFSYHCHCQSCAYVKPTLTKLNELLAWKPWFLISCKIDQALSYGLVASYLSCRMLQNLKYVKYNMTSCFESCFDVDVSNGLAGFPTLSSLINRDSLRITFETIKKLSVSLSDELRQALSTLFAFAASDLLGM